MTNYRITAGDIHRAWDWVLDFHTNPAETRVAQTAITVEALYAATGDRTDVPLADDTAEALAVWANRALEDAQAQIDAR